MRLLPKKPEPIPKPTGSLAAGTDPAEWILPVAPRRIGARLLQPWTFVHVSDPMVARAPHLFARCSDNQPPGRRRGRQRHSPCALPSGSVSGRS
jgi:hypothetical protein